MRETGRWLGQPMHGLWQPARVAQITSNARPGVTEAMSLGSRYRRLRAAECRLAQDSGGKRRVGRGSTDPPTPAADTFPWPETTHAPAPGTAHRVSSGNALSQKGGGPMLRCGTDETRNRREDVPESRSSRLTWDLRCPERAHSEAIISTLSRSNREHFIEYYHKRLFSFSWPPLWRLWRPITRYRQECPVCVVGAFYCRDVPVPRFCGESQKRHEGPAVGHALTKVRCLEEPAVSPMEFELWRSSA